MFGSDTRERIEAPVRRSIETRQATQQAEDRWRQDQAKLVDRLEALRQEQTRLQHEQEQLHRQVDATLERVKAKEKQLADIEQMSGQIEPFLAETIRTLKTVTSNDLPFLLTERRQRIDRLAHLTADPDIPVSEKYRKVMEALLVEAEYGVTIETYQETITVEGQTMLADIFRLGRISLFYQRLDRQGCGFYNVAAAAWQPLPASQNPPIQTAIDIAAKRKPVELLSLPVGRLVTR